jgi:hypothetical protein
VKLSTLLQVIGSGSVLLIVGVALVALGIGYGFHEATQLPLWACLCLIGLFIAIAGYALVDRGSEEAEEQIEKEMPVIDVLRSPWLTIGASILGGMLLQRLFRARSEIVVENILPVKAEVADATPSQTIAESEKPSTTTTIGSAVSDYFGDQLRTLATMATGAAATLGLKALGIPPVEQLIGELLGSDAPTEQTADSSGMRPSSEGESQGRSRAERASSLQHSHNGANYPGEFDATRE